MNKLFAVLFAFFPTIWGLSAATQKVARSCNYDPVLGTPLFSVASGPFYSPHKYIVWYIELKKIYTAYHKQWHAVCIRRHCCYCVDTLFPGTEKKT